MSTSRALAARQARDAASLTRTPRKKRNAKRLSLNKLRQADTELPEVILETDGLLGVVKPAGYAIQGDYKRANSNKWTDFVRMLQSEYGKLFSVDRLDAATSGAYIFARNRNQSSRLTELFEKGRVPKTFLAIVYGLFEERKQWLEAPEVVLSDGSKGRQLSGWFRVEEEETRKSTRAVLGAREVVNDISIIRTSSVFLRYRQPDRRFHLLRIEPRSSIKHAIRVQLALQLKAPVVGDYKYAELAQHSTFHWLDYEGSFALALHCLDVTISTYVNVEGSRRDKVVKGAFAEPSQKFAETLRKVDIKALDEGLVHYNGPRISTPPVVKRVRATDSDKPALVATSPADGALVPLVEDKPALAVKSPTKAAPAPVVNDKPRPSRAITTSKVNLQQELAGLDSQTRDRLRRTFDPERRAREAFDTSLIPSTPLTSVLIKHRPHDPKLSNEIEVVRQRRMFASRLVGMIELRRRRRAAKLAKANGINPNKLSRPTAREIRKRPRYGMSREYTPQRVAPSPKAIRRQQAAIGRARLAKVSRAMPPGARRW